MKPDGFEDLREQAAKQAVLTLKAADAKTKRDKAKESGNTKDFQDAVLADLDLIKAKLGI